MVNETEEVVSKVGEAMVSTEKYRFILWKVTRGCLHFVIPI